MVWKTSYQPNLPGGAQEAIDNMTQAEQASQKGVLGATLKEKWVPYDKANCEKVIDNKDNNQMSHIVFGRDRYGTKAQGYCNGPYSQASMIDIVAGRLGYKVDTWPTASTNNSNGKTEPAPPSNPDFINDSARIYISQMTNVDENFVLAPGSMGSPGRFGTRRAPKSAIALKADGIRIIAREGIKLVTGTNVKNSQGVKVGELSGIDLIAGNDSSKLQPIPLGINLRDALYQLYQYCDQLTGIVDALATHQHDLNEALKDHVHVEKFQAQVSFPSTIVKFRAAGTAVDYQSQVFESVINQKLNLKGFQNNYLRANGPRYINSRHNNTN